MGDFRLFVAGQTRPVTNCGMLEALTLCMSCTLNFFITSRMSSSPDKQQAAEEVIPMIAVIVTGRNLQDELYDDRFYNESILDTHDGICFPVLLEIGSKF